MVSLAGDLRLALDPAALAEEIGLELDGWQRDVLTSTAPRILMNCSRQSGKSTVAALLGVHTALYRPGSMVLMVSPTLRQSGEIYKKAHGFYRALGAPVSATSETALTLALSNGSRIVSLPSGESQIRGYTADLLIIDEASRVSDDLYLSTRPMLAVSRGRLVALSTPFGKRGWWFEAWKGGEPWERYKVDATQVPRISPEFLLEERRVLGEWWYAQEYMCEFRESVDSVFGVDDIEAAVTTDITPIFGREN
jgi:hypothetical protein